MHTVGFHLCKYIIIELSCSFFVNPCSKIKYVHTLHRIMHYNHHIAETCENNI